MAAMFIREKKLLWMVLLALGVANSAFSDAPQVTMTLDRKTITISEEINLTIRIKGAAGNLQRPLLPAVDSFTSYYTGRSAQTIAEEGGSTNVAEFNFTLVPKTIGKFTFPPVDVQIDDQIYRTASIDLEVLDSPDGKRASPRGWVRAQDQA